ncbi:hypothetical protein DYI37_03335 [Fulvimarina endophytica]|uniref:Uncharacterized protein n=1 Tax=Fulvimarina endophytica TaxID=2293836 RepID=A0A371XB98_9HYPH|nr:hypothetical protein [Fulvimarina endophytica]RFC66489.1 hypothetical protein DYI37_03335 [Fulvimarina endophytica]
MIQFENGHSYFTRDGRKVTYVAATADARHVVAQILQVETYDGDQEYAHGPITIECELFEKAPREIVDEEFREVEARARELEARSFELTSEALNAEREVRRRLDALKKYDGLDRIEDFIEGRITHVVEPGEYGGDYEISPLSKFEDVEYGRSKGLKLISLFGTTNGNLAWRVNSYRDGSGGGWNEIIPCASMEEAEQKRRDRIAADLAEQSEHFDSSRPYYFMVRVRAALKFGVPVSDEDMARYRVAEAEDIAKKQAAIENEIAERQERLARLQPVSARQSEEPTS